ncbi:hypothetical protein HYC85_022041 [Camellia sinensis]|uniref:Uncharacterized protein n=1 Tax=Camellia sinensis TaxID=4442 RepID=A0A7J7GN62_CAMSI|nr:hypothetical protein HYC85_022041 [Camellia sinensis]
MDDVTVVAGETTAADDGDTGGGVDSRCGGGGGRRGKRKWKQWRRPSREKVIIMGQSKGPVVSRGRRDSESACERFRGEELELDRPRNLRKIREIVPPQVNKGCKLLIDSLNAWASFPTGFLEPALVRPVN